MERLVLSTRGTRASSMRLVYRNGCEYVKSAVVGRPGTPNGLEMSRPASQG